jgi:hypothetical protein
MAVEVIWNKCQPGVWCPLSTVNLQHSHFDSMEGVYIIWHGGSPPRTVYIGTGVIRDRLMYHRQEAGGVQTYAAFGLFVTWAAVAPDLQAGVARFISSRFEPLIPLVDSGAAPVEVNVPF